MSPASRILTFGQVAIQTDGRTVGVTGRVADLLLLLLESSEGWVSRDALIDRLWADYEEAPPSARSALRTYIAKLRSMFGGSVVLTRATPCAYRLDRTAVRSDLDEVRDALRVARFRLGTDPASALMLLTEARERVVGEPLGGVDNPWLMATRMSTEELIDDLDDEFCVALVRSGHAVEHIEEITRLAEHRPLRERRAEMLMRALRQAGRRREALRVGARHHQFMVDQTGLSASAEIRLLEQELLVEDDREPSELHRPGTDDLLAAILTEPFLATSERLCAVLGITESELAELVETARTIGVLDGELGSFVPLTAEPVSEGTRTRYHERWLAVDLPIWRVLDHRSALGLLTRDDAGSVIGAARMACDEGEPHAASVLLERFLTADLMADRFGRGVDRRSSVDLLQTHAMVLDQLGCVEEALDKRAQAVDIALAEDWVDVAAGVAASESATGRSYIEDEDVTQLIRRTMSRLDQQHRSAHTIRLLSELLCRTVLDAGLTPELGPVYDRLVAMRPTLGNPVDQAHAYRARVYVAVSRGEVIEPTVLAEMTELCRDHMLFDHLGDLLAIAARCALEAGDGVGWRNSVDAISDFAATTRRPIDLWTRVAVRATDLQVRGQHQAAASQADDALLLASKWSIADADVTAQSFELSATWQRSLFQGADPDRPASDESVVAFARQILARSYRAELSPTDPLVDIFVRSCIHSSLPDQRALESLPALLIATQVAWNTGFQELWPELLVALSSWPVVGTAFGMIPVATVGPIGRFRGLACLKTGDLNRARQEFADALRWCDGMRASGWAAITLDDLAMLEDREGTGRANAVRAEAAYLRSSRRLRLGRPTGSLSTISG